jgi:acyl carrier protein
MTRDEFLAELGELLEANAPLTGPEELSGLGSWDSVAVIGVIAMIDENLGVTLDPKKIYACNTADDLFALLPSGARG